MIMVLFVLICSVVCASSVPESLGVVRVHTYPVCGAERHVFSGVDIAFLVDKEQGLFLAASSQIIDPVAPLVPFVRLETNKGAIMRCHLMQRVENLCLLQVCEADRGMLESMQEMPICTTPPKLNEAIRYMTHWRKNTWEHVPLGSIWNYDPYYSTVYNAPALSPSIVCGGPVISEANNKVVGIILRLDQTTAHILSGARLAFQWSHFKKKGTFFTAHIGATFYNMSIQELEEKTRRPFKVEGYDPNRLVHGQLLTVGAVWVEDGHLMAKDLQTQDVILFVDGHPVYKEHDIWAALQAVCEKGCTHVSVRVWRCGEEHRLSLPIYFFTNTIPKRIVRYGPCSFVEGVHHRNCACTYIQVSCSGAQYLAPTRLQKIDGKKIGTLNEIKEFLANNPHGGVWLQTKTLNTTAGGDRAFVRREEMYYINPTRKPMAVTSYVRDSVWRKEC